MASARMLEAQASIVHTVNTSAEALAKLTSEPPNLLLLEERMPGIEGFEVRQRIKSNSASLHVPVVLMTAQGDVDNREQTFDRCRGVSYVVIEMSRDLVEGLLEQGFPAVAGDTVEAEVLIQAHIARATLLIVAMPDAVRSCRMVELARMLNPNIRSIACAHSDEEAELLQHENFGGVFYGEQELANAMISNVEVQLHGPRYH